MRRVCEGRRAAALCALAAVLAAAAGCGFKPPKMVPVRGKVMRGGKAVEGMSLQFNPVDPKQKDNIGNAFTDANGEFKVTTYYPKAGQLDGAAVGKYKVVLRPYPGIAPQPPDYLDMDRTPWEVEVPPQGGVENLVLTIKE